jgi:predicted dehydrogenase
MLELKSRREIAVVGCGYWGKNLVRNFGELGALRAICDADPVTVDRFAQQYAATGTTDFDRVLALPDVTAVVIATPAPTHAQLAIAALAAGKDVFVEKPLALTLADAIAMQAALGKSDRILMVGHLLEYHPALVALRRIVADGKIGKLKYLYSHRLSPGKVRTEENVLWSFAPHDICAILGCVGQLPIWVRAFGSKHLGQVEDLCTIELEFANNIRARIFVSWFHPFKEQRLVVAGDTGSLVFDDVSVDRKLIWYEQQLEFQQQTPVLKNIAQTAISITPAEPLKSECQHFLDCIRTRTAPLTGIQNGIDVLTVLQAAQQSLETYGNPIYLRDLQDV